MASIVLDSSQTTKPIPRAPRRIWRNFLVHLFIFVLVALGAFFAHEFGHALVAALFGARVVMFNVLGMQWFPELEWLPQLGFGGYVSWWAPPDRSIHSLIVLAGSTSTLVLSILAAVALNLFHLAGLARTALVAMSLYVLDSLFKIFPIVGLIPRGWAFPFTRSFSEAYFAALDLGIPSSVYIAAVFSVCLAVACLLACAFRSSRSLRARDTIQILPFKD